MKLNLGSGDFILDGYVSIDRKFGGEVYPVNVGMDVHWQLPPEKRRGFRENGSIEDESCEEVRASHVLEHLPWRDTLNAIKEWVRVLKPGGVLKIAVPDFEWIARQYLAEVDDAAERQPLLTAYLMGGQKDENDYHKAIFDARGLKSGMELAGLVDVEPWESDAADCSSLAVSLNLKGRKPSQPTPSTAYIPPKAVEAPEKAISEPQEASDALPPGTIPFLPEEIACVLSVPRLGFMSNMQCLLSVANLGIPVRTQQGAFWGQCLTDAMLQFIEEGKCKYILTVDYDSIFTSDDVLNLYRYMASPGGEHIHALTTVQVRRENDNVLLTMADADGNPRGEVSWEEMQQEVVRVRTAHFGLTMLRVDALQRTPHPWFLDVPDEEGKWGPGKLDCDIEFWRKWQAAGNSLYLAPRIAIGHLEQVISFPDTSLCSIFQRMSDYQKNGKPPNVWR